MILRHTIMNTRLVLTSVLLVVTAAQALRAGPRNTDPRMLEKNVDNQFSSDNSPVIFKEMKQQGGKLDVNFLRLTEMLDKIDSDFVSRQDQVITPRPLPKSTTTAPQAQLRSLCLSRRGMFPHPLDCRKYVDCWDGRVIEKFCPNDLVFSDLEGGFCDYLEYVECGSRPVLVQQPYETEVP